MKQAITDKRFQVYAHVKQHYVVLQTVTVTHCVLCFLFNCCQKLLFHDMDTTRYHVPQ